MYLEYVFLLVTEDVGLNPQTVHSVMTRSSYKLWTIFAVNIV